MLKYLVKKHLTRHLAISGESLRDEEQTRGRFCISQIVVFRRICEGRSDCALWCGDSSGLKQQRQVLPEYHMPLRMTDFGKNYF